MGRTLTYDTGNTSTTYTVRDRTNRLYFTVEGAGAGKGGDASIYDGQLPSGGGYVEAYTDVSDDETFTIYVGEGGEDGESDSDGGLGGAGGLSPLANGGDGGDGETQSDSQGAGGGGGGATGVEGPLVTS